MFGDLIRWNPTEELSNWHRDIDELFGRFFQRPEGSIQSWVPRVETYRKDHDYVIKIDLPGVSPDDVHVETEGNLLTVSGERKGEQKGSEYRETFYGKFERQIALPQGVESGQSNSYLSARCARGASAAAGGAYRTKGAGPD